MIQGYFRTSPAAKGNHTTPPPILVACKRELGRFSSTTHQLSPPPHHTMSPPLLHWDLSTPDITTFTQAASPPSPRVTLSVPSPALQAPPDCSHHHNLNVTTIRDDERQGLEPPVCLLFFRFSSLLISFSSCQL